MLTTGGQKDNKKKPLKKSLDHEMILAAKNG